LVEDEDTVRDLAMRILRKNGYTVLSATSGRDAIKVAAKFPGEIHLVITDVVMPEMGGRDLATALAALRPAARILYISGYTDDEIIRRGLMDPSMSFLAKPFTATALTRKVREILDNPVKLLIANAMISSRPD
jgi:two-component system cell cycle sensor histidine kinase/response regulator CckA